MKYIFIFLFSFTLTGSALAAKQVSGTVPDLPPLQPTPALITPNYEKNIQRSDPSHPVEYKNANNLKLPEVENVDNHEPELAAKDLLNKKSYSWVFWLIAFGLVCGAGYLVYKGLVA